MDDESNQNHIKLFQNQQIRAKWDNLKRVIKV